MTPASRLREGESPPFSLLPAQAKTGETRLAGRRPRGVTQTRPTGILFVKREPLFNIPSVVIAVLALLAFVHVVRTLLLSDDQNIEFLLNFAFIPARYDSSTVPGGLLPGGVGAEIWTFVTYSLIHADWIHLGVNAVWLLPFGSAVARRFGAVRFLGFCTVTAAAGAAMHLATHAGEQYPMIGASATISGLDGGGDAFRVPARRPARISAR